MAHALAALLATISMITFAINVLLLATLVQIQPVAIVAHKTIISVITPACTARCIRLHLRITLNPSVAIITAAAVLTIKAVRRAMPTIICLMIRFANLAQMGNIHLLVIPILLALHQSALFSVKLATSMIQPVSLAIRAIL